MAQPFWKISWQSLTKIYILLPYNLVILFIGIYTNKLKTYVHKNSCTQMFIAASFIVAEIWKQARCLIPITHPDLNATINL